MTRFVGPALGAVLIATAGPAIAQECQESVKALFNDGPMDPFERPPYVSTTVFQHPDGSETFSVEATWETPGRVKSITPTSNIISIGSTTWTAPSPDGPWTEQPNSLPEDIEAFHQKQADELMRNATEFSCPGTEVLDGRTVAKYTYRTLTDPNEWGSWHGGLYTSYVDVETNYLVRLEISEAVASWAPEKSPDVSVTTLVYDPTIKIDPPE